MFFVRWHIEIDLFLLHKYIIGGDLYLKSSAVVGGCIHVLKLGISLAIVFVCYKKEKLETRQNLVILNTAEHIRVQV